jgi:glutaredoxin-like YruB-family protein
MKSAPRIVVFSTPSCGWCRKVKSYLRDKGYKYRDVDITRDQKAAQDLQRRTGVTSVPVVLINNRPVIGFNQRKIEKLLKHYA